MTIFYRGPCVRITHKVFETRFPAGRAYSLDELDRVRVVEWTAEPPVAISSTRIGSTSVAGAAAVAFALSQAEGWQALDSPLAQLALIGLLVISVTVGGACWRTRAIVYELAAEHRGEPVSLYRSADARDFGQVQRALLRALEQLGETR